MVKARRLSPGDHRRPGRQARQPAGAIPQVRKAKVPLRTGGRPGARPEVGSDSYRTGSGTASPAFVHRCFTPFLKAVQVQFALKSHHSTVLRSHPLAACCLAAGKRAGAQASTLRCLCIVITPGSASEPTNGINGGARLVRYNPTRFRTRDVADVQAALHDEQGTWQLRHRSQPYGRS